MLLIQRSFLIGLVGLHKAGDSTGAMERARQPPHRPPAVQKLQLLQAWPGQKLKTKRCRKEKAGKESEEEINRRKIQDTKR